MKKYKTRPGVVLTKIAGRYILVAAKTIQGECPAAAEINETTAKCWRTLEKTTDFDSLFTKLSEEYEIDDCTAAKADLLELLEQLKDANYLIEEP